MMDFIRNYSAEGKIDLAFSVANGAKDVGYYRQMAKELGAKSRMSGAADATLREARDNGFGERMVPELVDYLAQHLKD
jgi:2-hydroxy-3-oxopropionate reductase